MTKVPRTREEWEAWEREQWGDRRRMKDLWLERQEKEQEKAWTDAEARYGWAAGGGNAPETSTTSAELTVAQRMMTLFPANQQAHVTFTLTDEYEDRADGTRKRKAIVTTV